MTLQAAPFVIISAPYLCFMLYQEPQSDLALQFDCTPSRDFYQEGGERWNDAC